MPRQLTILNTKLTSLPTSSSGASTNLSSASVYSFPFALHGATSTCQKHIFIPFQCNNIEDKLVILLKYENIFYLHSLLRFCSPSNLSLQVVLSFRPKSVKFHLTNEIFLLSFFKKIIKKRRSYCEEK